MAAFINNAKNYKCLETYAKTCKLFGAKNETVKTQIAQTLDQVCSVVMPKLLKPATAPNPNAKLDFVMRLDTDVATAFADLLTQVVEINPEAFASCNSLDATMKFFCDSLAYVVQAQ